MNIIDIETIALPDEQLASVKPTFEPPANYKDPEKIRANLADQEARWKEQAALSAMTGRVAVIGVLSPVGKFDYSLIVNELDEADFIREFWVNYGHGSLIGWNIKGFDLPFLIQRSWILGLRVPSGIFNGRYFSQEFCIDLMERWACCQPGSKGIASLDSVSRACGMGGKTINGSDFAKLWAEDKQKALNYCHDDCSLTLSLAKRMGVL
jgi:predicted PolB exonuclease-like 3'-5' exonuclease